MVQREQRAYPGRARFATNLLVRAGSALPSKMRISEVRRRRSNGCEPRRNGDEVAGVP